jgi:hypothetical protein
MSLPLKVGDRVIGVLNLNNKKSSKPFTEQEYKIAVALSDKIADYIKRIYTDPYHEDEFQQFLSSVDSLIRAEYGRKKP